MNRGLSQLEELDVTKAQWIMIDYYLKGDVIGLMQREVLTNIDRKATYNCVDKPTLNVLRDKYMAEVVHKNDGTTKHYVVVDSNDTENPIKAFKTEIEAKEVSDTVDIIYANSTDNVVELFIEKLKKWKNG